MDAPADESWTPDAGPVQPDCSPFPNTICDVASGDDGGKCATCVPMPTTP